MEDYTNLVTCQDRLVKAGKWRRLGLNWLAAADSVVPAPPRFGVIQLAQALCNQLHDRLSFTPRSMNTHTQTQPSSFHTEAGKMEVITLTHIVLWKCRLCNYSHSSLFICLKCTASNLIHIAICQLLFNTNTVYLK